MHIDKLPFDFLDMTIENIPQTSVHLSNAVEPLAKLISECTLHRLWH